MRRLSSHDSASAAAPPYYGKAGVLGRHARLLLLSTPCCGRRRPLGPSTFQSGPLIKCTPGMGRGGCRAATDPLLRPAGNARSAGAVTCQCQCCAPAAEHGIIGPRRSQCILHRRPTAPRRLTSSWAPGRQTPPDRTRGSATGQHCRGHRAEELAPIVRGVGMARNRRTG